MGSLLFSWVPTSRVTVSGELHENARHTSSNGFTGVRGDRRMRHGIFSWSIDITETQSSWIFVGVVQAEDTNDVAWRATGHMLYCLDSRFFHQGSGQNHPMGDRKIVSGDSIRVVLDCTRHTLAFGVNEEQPIVLFRDLEATWYVAAVDLRDCGDKVRILSSRQTSSSATATLESRRSQITIFTRPESSDDALEEAPEGPRMAWTSGQSDEAVPRPDPSPMASSPGDRPSGSSLAEGNLPWQSEPRRHTVQMPMLETVPALATRLSQPRQFGSVSVTVTSGGTRPTLPGGQGLQSPSVRPSLGRGTSRGRAASQRGSSPEPAVLAQVAHGATMEVHEEMEETPPLSD